MNRRLFQVAETPSPGASPRSASSEAGGETCQPSASRQRCSPGSSSFCAQKEITVIYVHNKATIEVRNQIKNESSIVLPQLV